MDYKKEIVSLLKKELNLPEDEIFSLIEIPPNPSMGDYAFPCFSLSKILKKNPVEIADELANKIKNKNFERIEAKGPYLNFFINKNKLALLLIKEILKQNNRFAYANKQKNKILIEYPSPNTNKPLHLGHVRNIVTGQSVSNLLESQGNKVIQVNLNNDRGIHICKSMLAYKKFGNNKRPNKKPDHFVGDFYVLFEKNKTEELEKEAQQMLLKWENNDKETMLLWKKMNSWALKGFNETYRKFNLKHDKTYNESEFYDKAKSVVFEGLKKGIFYKDENSCISVDLTNYGLDKKVLLRPDETSIYITQDIYLTLLKYKAFKPDRLITLTATEQIYHFKVLFKILELLKSSFAKNCLHLSYGMVNLPHGRMKSREGAVVDADDLILELENLAKKEILKRHKEINKKELEKRSSVIAMSALRFYLLKYDLQKDILFNPEESISFEGDTGPFVQYAHARICSILRKNKKQISKNLKFENLNEYEKEIVRLLSLYKEVSSRASEEFKPSLVTHYLLDLTKAFNKFYENCPVLDEKEPLRSLRLSLIMAVKNVLISGLNLLQIEAPERM